MLVRLGLVTCCLLTLTIGQGHGLGPPSRQPRDAIRPAIPMPKTADTAQETILYGTPLFPRQESDTLYFGGTAWNSAKARWEAIPDSVWTFESGVGSAINQDSTVKAVGLHSTMEGWYGLDMTTPSIPNPFHLDTTCAISGEWSLWAGISGAAPESLFWRSGQGYGNNWLFECEKTFAYPVDGQVSLSFKYRVESELDFDFLRVLIDTSGVGSASAIPLAAYTGTVEGTATLPLIPGETLPSESNSIRLIFRVEADNAYSDEDGLYPTSCGHSVLDDVTLTGAVSDVSDFENGWNGWERSPVPLGPGGDWSDIRSTSGLDPSGCACVFGDSVLAFIDPSGDGHGFYQHNVAVSPWIDLAAHGVSNRAGKILEWRGYWDLPLRNWILVTFLARWRPAQLPPPLGGTPDHGFHSPGFVYYQADSCYCPGYGSRDLSRLIPPDAEEVQIALGIVTYCRFFAECSQLTNQTPWFDDLRFGVYETPVPNARLSADPLNLARDAFPEATSPGDFPHQTARFDSHGRFLVADEQDLLIVRTDYAPSPSSVHVVFRVRPGPAIDASRLSAWLAGFTMEANGWVSARMDTVDQGDGAYEWRTVFHEDDPLFQAPEDAPDPEDPSPPGEARFKNDMFPDDLFTPGTRIDYFFKWTAGGVVQGTSFLPDTTGGTFFEMEVLPSSLVLTTEEPGYVHNAVLWVDRIGFAPGLVESVLAASFPGGSSNAENVAWDRFDLNRDRPLVRGENPASLNGYQTIIWTSEHLNPWLHLDDDNPESDRLQAWLRTAGSYASGCARNLYYCAKIYGSESGSLLVDLGIEEISGSIMDNSDCVQVLGDPGGSHFGGAFDARVPGYDPNGLVAAPSTSVADNRINLRYQIPNLVPASVSAYHQTPTGCWRSVYDGFPIAALRADPSCDDMSDRVAERLDQVLDWFASDLPTPVSLLTFEASREAEGVVLRWRTALAPSDHVGFDVYRSVAGARQLLTDRLLSGLTDYVFIDALPPSERTEYWLHEHLRDGTGRWLGPAVIESAPLLLRVMTNAPNPFRDGTTLRIQMPRSSHVLIRVFGPRGEVVARIFDGPLGPGIQDIVWDGRDATGRPVPSGVYLYRVETMGADVTRKMLKLAP